MTQDVLETTMNERERFHLARRRRRIGQAEIAYRVGVSQTAISRWEKGTLDLPAPRVNQFWDALKDIIEDEAS